MDTTNHSRSRGRSGSYSTSEQQAARDLLTPDEVRLLPDGKAVLFVRGERPVIDDKYNLLRHPCIRFTEDGGAPQYDYTSVEQAADDLPGEAAIGNCWTWTISCRSRIDEPLHSVLSQINSKEVCL